MALDFGQNKEFGLAKDRAKQQEAANLQGQKDALARRAAQMGGGPSGAFVKQEQVAGDESAKRLASANEGIDAMQAQETRRVNEIEQGQNFVKGESVGSQDFAAGQAKIGREYGTSERLGSQAFASGEAEIGRKYQSSERLGSQSFADEQRRGSQGFAEAEAALSRQVQSSQFLQQLDQTKAAFAHEQYIDQKNLDLAARIQKQNETPSTMDHILGIGTLGVLGSTSGLPGGGKMGAAKRKMKTWRI